MKDGSSWKFCHSKIQQKIQGEGIHHSKEINKKKHEAFSEATQDEIDKWCRRIKSTATSPFNLQSHEGNIQTTDLSDSNRTPLPVQSTKGTTAAATSLRVMAVMVLRCAKYVCSTSCFFCLNSRRWYHWWLCFLQKEHVRLAYSTKYPKCPCPGNCCSMLQCSQICWYIRFWLFVLGPWQSWFRLSTRNANKNLSRAKWITQ